MAGRTSVATRARSLLASVAALGAACGEPPAAPTASVASTACEACTWGVPAYDALSSLAADGEPWIFAARPLAASPQTLTRARALATEALQADPDRLSDRARVILQNDLWGLARRLEGEATSSEPAEALRSLAWALVRRLALPTDRLARLDGHATSPWVTARLAPDDGWREIASEMPVLSHELAFDLRRVFRLARNGEQIALFSQLVAIDDRGAAHLTSVAGEIEALTMRGGEAVSARVWELDRRAVSRTEGETPLRAVDVVAHVPARGADRFIATFDPPARLADLPCLSCHHDPDLQSLPRDDLDPAWRWPALLEQATARAMR